MVGMRARLRRAALAAALLLALPFAPSCAGPASAERGARAATAPLATAAASTASATAAPALPAGFLPVPIVRQAHPYSCGAAVLLAVLYYWQVEDCGEAALYEELSTTEEEGTAPESLVRGARARGLAAELRQGLSLDDLRAALARGETAIVDLQAWREDEEVPWKERWDDGHYVVLVAMDERNAYVMDPSTCASYAWLPLDELLDRWRDYETRTGKRVEYVRAAILVRGRTPLGRIPAPPQRME
jgi:predicted double-glycine peptidase